MALVFQRNEISLECTGMSVTVPDNDVARLMLYLHCVCTTIDCNRDPEIQRFTDYNNWHYLSIDEQRQLLVVCYTFSPSVFNNRVFFHNDALCGSSSNQFYTINQVRHQLLAAESIVIAGQVREVNKIMTYKMAWMKTYYYDPMERLVTRLGTSSRPNRHESIYTPSVVRQPAVGNSASKCTLGRICCFLYCIVFILPGIIGIIVGIISVATK